MSKMLCDVAEIIDSLHKTPNYKANGIPMVRVMDVKNDFLNLENCFTVDESTCNEHNKNHVPQMGDMIITRVGSYGMLAYVNTGKKFCLGQNIAIISPKENGKFLYYYLKSPFVQSIIYGNSGGSSYKCISLEEIKKLPYYDDNLDVKKIGELLYSIDSKIENNNKINTVLESMAKTIYDYWFLQYEFPNADGKPYKSSGGKMAWNKELKREIPEGWRAGNLEDIASITMGTSPKGKSINMDGDGIVFYQGKSDFGSRFPMIRTYTTDPIRYAEKNDVLLSVRAPVGTLNIANQKCCIGRGLAAIHSEYSSFVFYLLIGNQHKFDIYNNGGTTFGAITKDDLFGMRFVIPSIEIVRKFEGKIKNIDQKIDKCTVENQELTSLRDFLLPLLMNGQVGFKN